MAINKIQQATSGLLRKMQVVRFRYKVAAKAVQGQAHEKALPTEKPKLIMKTLDVYESKNEVLTDLIRCGRTHRS